jgi:hypothetical protein
VGIFLKDWEKAVGFDSFSAEGKETVMVTFNKGGRNYPRLNEKDIDRKLKTLGGLKAGDIVEMEHIGHVAIGSVKHSKQEGWVVKNAEGHKINVLKILRVVESGRD